jgi:hypothetical protein
VSEPKGKTEQELEAWDRYAAAAIAGIASRAPADCVAVAGEAALYATAMLEERRAVIRKIRKANSPL